MKVEEPMLKRHTSRSALIPHLRSYIVNKVETEDDMAILQRLYSVVSPDADETYEEQFAKAKRQTEQYCVPEIAEELESEGYMIGKPYPYDDEHFDFDQAIKDDAHDGLAPQEWVDKMFPELHVRG